MAVLETTDQLGGEHQGKNVQPELSQHSDTERVPRAKPSIRKQDLFYAEEYEAELDRMNNSMLAENQALQRDNKQLNALIKDYEQTLDSLMS
ncbi:hypothetical protein H0H93_002259 [Arthromyces matolae]|nr:hypothetical protein H0H93_002259 [Arthromyces matolae]